MAYVLGQPFVQQFVDAAGLPIVGGSIEFYLTGTSTATPIYSDDTGTSQGTSVGLGLRGQPISSGGTSIALYFDDSITYKIVVKDSSGTAIAPTIDPYRPKLANLPYLDASNYVTDYSGATDQSANLTSAFTDAVSLGYTRVFLGESGTISVGTLGLVTIPVGISEVFGGGMDSLFVKYDDSNTTGGRGDGLRTESAGHNGNLYLHDFTIKGIRDQNTTVAMGNPAMGIQMAGGSTGHLIIERVGAQLCRNQAINATGWASLHCSGCRLVNNARGGLSFRNMPYADIHDNYVEGNGDDSIFCAHIDGAADDRQVVGARIHHNTIVQGSGIRVWGGKGCTINNNTFIRPVSFAITAYIIDAGSSTNLSATFGVRIQDNVVLDCLARGELDGYNSTNTYINLVSPDRVAATGEPIAGRPFTASGNVQKPIDYFWEEDTSPANIGRVGAWYHEVSGNTFLSTIEPGQTLTGMGFNQYYNVTDDGASGEQQDYTITEAMLLCDGIKMHGPINHLRIKNNQIVMPKGGRGIFFQDSDFDYSLMDIDISDNEFVRAVDTNAIQFSFATTDKKCKVSIRNNRFVGDPWFESVDRTGAGTTGDPFTGAWANSSTGAAIDNSRAIGMIIENNEFEAFPVILNSTNTNTKYVKDNIIYCEPVAVGYDAGNKGVGNVPEAGAAFTHIVMDSTPTSTSYREITTTPKVSASAKPTTGTYVQGHRVINDTPTILNDGSDYVIDQWVRITTGSGHVAGTDWFEIRGRG